MKKSTLLIAGLLALGSTSMHADEGMWTLYNLPDAVYEQMVAEGFQFHATCFMAHLTLLAILLSTSLASAQVLLYHQMVLSSLIITVDSAQLMPFPPLNMII